MTQEALGKKPADRADAWPYLRRCPCFRLSLPIRRPPVAARLSGRTRPAHVDRAIRNLGGLHHRYARIWISEATGLVAGISSNSPGRTTPPGTPKHRFFAGSGHGLSMMHRAAMNDAVARLAA